MDLPTDTIDLAKFLIGKVLVHETADGITAGRIVETEAYVVGDASSHAFRGETHRNRSMFGRVGLAYVYRIYGSSLCQNVVSESANVGAAVLLRALEPIAGIDLMVERRGISRVLDLTRGPGRLTAAMKIDLTHDGLDLVAGCALRLEKSASEVGSLGRSRRIGISKNAHRVLRFYERGNKFVSGPARLRR
jgi:DNA-3-methyladenine glycosylase